ncbi:MAG TPA: hypothetical protein V6D22_02495 [Candidatus Obscuribacterales bacterium]
MAVDVQAKQEQLAGLLNGSVIDSEGRVAVCVRGAVDGFRATLEALAPSWPFGVSYFVEAFEGVDPSSRPTRPAAKMTICPRIGRGMSGLLTNVLLFEARSMRINDKKLESTFNFTYDEREMTEKFLHWPGVQEALNSLDQIAKFTEAVVRTDAGIFLAQPKSFNALDLDQCMQVFGLLGQLAGILAENF